MFDLQINLTFFNNFLLNGSNIEEAVHSLWNINVLCRTEINQSMRLFSSFVSSLLGNLTSLNVKFGCQLIASLLYMFVLDGIKL